MSIERPRIKWECIDNHLPKWICELDVEFSNVIPKAEHDHMMALLDRYNDLTDREESDEEDGFSLYGVEDEKKEIIDSVIKTHEKYRSEAESIRKKLKDAIK